MTHVREEFALVAARGLQLGRLDLDLVEQAHVLDGDDGLSRKGFDQLDLALDEGPRIPRAELDRTDRSPVLQKWDGQVRTVAVRPRVRDAVVKLVVGKALHVRDVVGPRERDGARND